MVLSDVSVTEPKSPGLLLRTRAERIKYAVYELEGKSFQKVERALGFSDGDLSKYASGKRGGSTVDVDKMAALAAYLHVEFDWLVRGVGPVRSGGRGTTPAEEAIVLARRSGTPEEVIQAAWDRYKDRQATMTGMDWALVIHNEHQVSARPVAQEPKLLGAGAPPARVDAARTLRPRRPGAER